MAEYMPLEFWFNRNPELAIPCIYIPQQAVYIDFRNVHVIHIERIFQKTQDPSIDELLKRCDLNQD